jgi:hypothetical protein
VIGGWVLEWSHPASGDKGIRPSDKNKHVPEWFKRRSDALDVAAHLNVRAHAYTYKAIPAIGRKLVGPYRSKAALKIATKEGSGESVNE